MDTDWYLLLSTDCRDYFVYDELQFFSNKCHNFLYIGRGSTSDQSFVTISGWMVWQKLQLFP